mmetsp:Transcript_16278/g.38665  ORF Transcript_16278/g.38665 Transcript_16278/m.38665 type:complete len:286 (-) Transcript_16278:1114-1971(-)
MRFCSTSTAPQRSWRLFGFLTLPCMLRPSYWRRVALQASSGHMFCTRQRTDVALTWRMAAIWLRSTQEAEALEGHYAFIQWQWQGSKDTRAYSSIWWCQQTAQHVACVLLVDFKRFAASRGLSNIQNLDLWTPSLCSMTSSRKPPTRSNLLTLSGLRILKNHLGRSTLPLQRTFWLCRLAIRPTSDRASRRQASSKCSLLFPKVSRYIQKQVLLPALQFWPSRTQDIVSKPLWQKFFSRWTLTRIVNARTYPCPSMRTLQRGWIACVRLRTCYPSRAKQGPTVTG